MKAINLIFGGLAQIFGALLVIERMQMGEYFWVGMGCLGIIWGVLTVWNGIEKDKKSDDG